MKDKRQFSVITLGELMKMDFQKINGGKRTAEELELAEKFTRRTSNIYEEMKPYLPRLAEIEAKAKAYSEEVKDSPRACANEIFYGYGSHEGRGLKKEIVDTVGYEAGWPRGHFFGSSLAYDVVYDAIYDLLPPCSDQCLCM